MTERSRRSMLVISASYAPTLNARAFRWTALARHFAGRGWEVDVVTKTSASAPSSGEENPERVHRVGWRWLEALRARGAARTPGAALPRRRRVPAMGRTLWRAVYWPDGDCPWYWPARQAALRLVRKNAYHAIVSVAPSFTAVLVGRAASDAANASRWIIDLGDPFSLDTEIPHNNVMLYRSLNRRTERRMFSAADAISVTTAATAERYRQAFPECSEKLHVIPPMFSMSSTKPRGELFARDTTVRLVYVGTLYPKLREPTFLLQLFSALLERQPARRLQLHFFGDMQAFAGILEDWSRRLSGAVCMHGTVPRERIAQAVEEADVLVNIGNSTRDQLPSKLVEYAAAGKPILNLASHAHDSSVAFLETYPDKLDLVDDASGVAPGHVEALVEFMARLPRRLAADAVDRWLAPYQLPRIAERYEEILE